MMLNFLPRPEAQVHLVLIALLVYVIVDDLRNFRVRNDVVLAIGALTTLYFVLIGDWHVVLIHLALGLVLFVVLMFLYARGWMGGGDVKLLVAAFLWLGPAKAQLFVLALTAFATLYGMAAKFMLVPAKYVGTRVKVPYAPSIALAWIAAILLASLF